MKTKKIIALSLLMPLIVGGKIAFHKYRNYRADIYQVCSAKKAELIRNKEIYENILSDEQRAIYAKIGIDLPEGNLYSGGTNVFPNYNPETKELHPCDWIKHRYGRKNVTATGSR